MRVISGNIPACIFVHSEIMSIPLCVAVHISFQTSHLTVREDSESVHVQLQSSGLYGRNFSVSFACIPIFPVEAKG